MVKSQSNKYIFNQLLSMQTTSDFNKTDLQAGRQATQQDSFTKSSSIPPSKQEDNPLFKSTMDKINILTRINFLYAIPLLIRGFKANRKNRNLEDKDLLTIRYRRRGEVYERQFVEHLNSQKRKNPQKQPSTALAVAMTLKWTFLRCVLTQILFGFLRIFSTWVMKRLIESYLDPVTATTDSFWWAAILAGVLVLALYFEHHWNYIMTYLCGFARGGIISMVYTKITKLSVFTITRLSPGKLVNVVANDINVFEIYGVYFPSIISAWFILVAAGALLWIYFGVTCLLGLGYMVALLPIQAYIAFASVKPRAQKNAVTDERVRKTSEAIEGIRLLKMYTWETKFQKIISDLRKKDVQYMRKVLYYGDVLARGLAWSSQYMASFLTFMLFWVTGGDLTISKGFSAYFIFGFLRVYFVYFLTNAFNFVAETRLLFRRLDEIMDAPEMGEDLFEPPKDPRNAIEFENFTSYWAMTHSAATSTTSGQNLDKGYILTDMHAAGLRPTLEDINLNIKKGSLNAVVGTVGASKTTFLLSLTGEMPKSTGSLRYKGRIAYVEQEPTIFAGTFRESILFGREYNEEFYNQVIKACNLESDLKLFPKGDMSPIGERGNNLSGGQKARLALARAVYSDADIYLLDDPISAVDAKVAKSIFNETILGLLKNKTVILVTHQVHFVKDLENIIVMENGKITAHGNFAALAAQGVNVDKIFSTQENSRQVPLSRELSKVEKEKAAIKEEEDARMLRDPNTKPQENLIVTQNVAQRKGEDNAEGPTSFNSDEDPYAGKVNLKTYALLFRQVGIKVLLPLLVVYVLVQFGDVAFGRILGAWVSGEFGLGKSLGALGGIAGYMIVMHQVKNMLFSFGFLNASRKYHKKMLEKVMRSPVIFFDTNPVGRILNRFSNDTGVLDKFVPHVGLDVFDILASALSVFITLAIIQPILLGPIAVYVVVIVIVVVLCYPTIKLTKGYDLATRGPLFSLYSSSISGIVIIRTYGQTEHFKQRFTRLMHTNTKGGVNFILSSKFLSFCIDALYVLTAIGMVYITTGLISPEEGPSSGAIAGFTLALILSLTGIFQHGVRQFCMTNVLMASAARVQAYCDLPSEAPLSVPEDEQYKEKKWPENGDIDFSHVHMKYRPDTDFVIRDLNLHADSGQKIGCVGRTGAGKSTIINLLFRLQEVDRSGDHVNSYITLDKTNTQPLGLHLLRGNISIIPQSPFIFTGTVKQNVDPLGCATDEQIWNVLEEVRLKEHVMKLPDKLETKMHNASAVFSVGQKQLVCLARTLLKPCKVLVLDEATANMDTETDTFIQHKIMEKFKNSTVFTIAHRLATIADYDKVLVLDKGQKVEFDAPYKLLVKEAGDTKLTNPTGHFGSMVANTGPATAQRIVNIARQAYYKDSKNK